MTEWHVMYFLDYGQFFGGAANTLLNQAILMKKAGLKITVVISDYLSKDLEKGYLHVCENSEVKWMQLTYPICSHTEDIDIISVLQNYESVKTSVAELKPDILHSVQINPIVELISRELNIPHVMNIYQLLPEFFSINYMDIFPHFHICDSNYFAEKWRKYLGTESICIRTTVHKYSRFSTSENLKNPSLNYMCVGSLSERKNQFEVIKAFHQALQYGIKGILSVYGYCEGEYADKCRNYIAKYGLDRYILLKGFCSDMSVEYQKNNVLICGSMMESYPNVISEALANGLIVISTPVAGVPEVIADHFNGYLCNGFDGKDIFEKLVEFNKERYSYFMDEMLRNMDKTFEDYHSEKVVSRKLLAYYHFLLDENKDRGNRRILVDEVKQEFAFILSVYRKNRFRLTDEQAVEQKLWYIYHIRDIIAAKVFKEKKQVYIWGTGRFGRIAKDIFDVFWENIKIEGYIDSYKKGFFKGYKIVLPKDVIKDDKAVIILAAVNGQEEMLKQLNKAKKVFHSDYFLLSPRMW